MGVEPTPRDKIAVRGLKDGSRATPTTFSTPTTHQSKGVPELELSPMSRKVKHFDKYSRKGGRWSWKRPSYERGVVSLVKTERRIEEGIASALTEVEAVEAGLRYFDELIMPPNKASSATTMADGAFRRPPAFPPPPAGHFPPNDQQRSAEAMEAAPSNQSTKERNGPGSRSNGGQARGGFSRSQEISLRDYRAAKKSGIGRGSRITSSTDRAVSECVDLKLTLRQRLDNYDRQRGINLNFLDEDGASTASPVPVIQGRQNNDGAHSTKTRGTNIGPRSSRASTVGTGSGDVQGGGELAPFCEGGTSDNGSVGQILARSLGNAASTARRNRPAGGDVGNSGSGGNQDQGRSVARSRWRSWNEAPPHALLTAEEVRSESEGREDDVARRQQQQPPDVVAEVVPPLQSRRRLKGRIGHSINPDGKKDLPENRAPGLPGAAAAKGTPNSEARSRESKQEEPLSTASSASSRRPLVPRVATLAAAGATADKSQAEAARKGKDFDPDQLECVRRHEASVAEKERRVQSLRREEEKRTRFRARPLPVFCESGSEAGPGGRAPGGGGGVYQSRPVESAVGAAGTSPELLAALEQDEEARTLAEKIRKLNPRADIASIVLQSTPRAPASSQTPWNNDGGGGTARRPSSSLSGREGATAATVATRNGGSEATPPVQVHAKDATSNAQINFPPAPGTTRPHKLAEPGGGTPDLGPPVDSSSKEESPHSSSSRDFETGSPSASARAGSDGAENNRRSLMGRMLGSGMLERQREWAKARNRKVLESRRQVEEAKEREAKGDILDAGRSGRSWSKAKTEHLRSLQRQREEEEAREQIQEARRRASELRAERERRLAEERAAELAQTLATAEDAKKAVGLEGGRESRTAPNSRGSCGGRRSRKPPRRPRSDVADNRVIVDSPNGGGIVPPSGGGRRRREGDPRPGNGGADSPAAREGNGLLSEDSFYRVAVEKIIERERLGAEISDEHGDGRVSGGSGGGGKSGGSRNSSKRRTQDEARKGVVDPTVFASPRGAAPDRPARRKSLMAPRNRRKASGAARAPLAQAAGRRRPPEGRARTGQGRYPFEPNLAPSLASCRQVTRTSSLLSLYEAQSVEHVAAAGGGGGDGGRDNSGPYLDDEGGTLLGLKGSMVGPPYDLERHGKQGERRATPAAIDRPQAREARERKASPAETGEGGDYPWSDKSGAPWSHGSGGGAARHPGRGNVAPGALLADERRGEPQWDDVLTNGERYGSSAGEIEGVAKVADVSVGHRDYDLGAATTGNHGLLPLPTEGADGHHHPAVRAHRSPRDPSSSTQGRREHIVSPTRATPPSPEADQRHSWNHGVGGVVDDGEGTTGARFSLWSSSDEDASVTEVFGGDEDGDEDGDNENGWSGYGSQTGGANGLASRSAAAASDYDMSGGAFLAVTAPAGSFFDAATSSADKGRYKVRDPRLFDPCSMCRRPDTAATVTPTLTPLLGAGAGSRGDGGGSASGVTLLLGCRVENGAGGDRTGDNKGEGTEQVITVMFDRSKFNEQEARRWWTANRARIESVGDPRG